MTTKLKSVLFSIILILTLILIAVLVMLLGQLIELNRLALAAFPVIIIRIDADGVLRQVFSTDPETQVAVYNQEGINAGDEPALSDHDITELMEKATPHCAAEIKAGKFYEVW